MYTSMSPPQAETPPPQAERVAFPLRPCAPSGHLGHSGQEHLCHYPVNCNDIHRPLGQSWNQMCPLTSLPTGKL